MTLLDAALDRVGRVVPVGPRTVAVNAHWLAEQVVAHVAGRAHMSVESPAALGTAGAGGAPRGGVGGGGGVIAEAAGWDRRGRAGAPVVPRLGRPPAGAPARAR